MNYRKLGRTEIVVSEIGFGAWGIGGALWKGSQDDESVRALHKAIDLGVNFFDTALAYGQGHSERLIASVLRGRRERIYVATKIPPKNGEWPARSGSKLRDVFPYDYVIHCTERSLRNLRSETIDLQQFHVWNDDWTDDAEWSDAIAKLKEEGKIRLFGVSINDHQPENALKLGESGKADTFQVIYNIFDQSPEEKLFPFCRKNGIGVIVRVPFDEGSLTGSVTPETTFPAGDFRERYFQGDRKREVFERVRQLKGLLDGEAGTLPELALRFVLNNPAVSTVIPGMRRVPNVEANCKVSDGRRLSEKLVAQLRKQRWERNFY
jgi:aryl-alcohol dehydrogenase-like predicted oxidoreductase